MQQHQYPGHSYVRIVVPFSVGNDGDETVGGDGLRDDGKGDNVDRKGDDNDIAAGGDRW